MTPKIPKKQWWSLRSSGKKTDSPRPVFRFTGPGARAALEATRVAVKNLLGNVKPSHVPGRDERMRRLVEAELAHASAVAILPHPDTMVAQVQVEEAFGKPLLVTVDLLVPDPDRALLDLPEEEQTNLVGLAKDLLDRVVRAIWDNDEVVPVSIRGRVLIERDPEVIASAGHLPEVAVSLRPGEVVVVDMESLGFTDEIARSEDLYARLGPPAADPAWKP